MTWAFVPGSSPATKCTAAVTCARGIRERGLGYVLAVRSDYPVTLPSGRTMTV